MSEEKRKPPVFLTAKWKNLINATYAVPPSLLEPYLPSGLNPDIREGNAFVSLVAFEFQDTRLKGIRIPFHANFPEINLRYYVNHNGQRGVAFIREFVPKFWIAWFARQLYNEPYRKIRMKSTNREDRGSGTIEVLHNLKTAGKEFFIEARAMHLPYLPESDSLEHFFKEHEFGFGRSRTGKTLRYQVEHPAWDVYPVTEFRHNIDFEMLYGREWRFLNQSVPANVLLAAGSEVKVFGAEKL